MKLLNFPAEAAHILDDLHVVLPHLVGHNIVRALGRKHYSENFHLVFGRKAFDFDDFALLLLRCTPGQTIDPLVRFLTARIIHLPVIFEWTVVTSVPV